MHRHLHFVLEGFIFLAFVQVVALNLSNELDGVELAVFVATGQVHLAESSNRKAVINLISERILGRPIRERIKKLGLFQLSLVQTQPIIEVEIAIDGLEPNNTPHHPFYFLHVEFATDEM